MRIITDNATGKAFITAQNKALALPTGVDLNIRHYEFTIGENTTYPLEAASDSIIAEHYDDTSARILIVPKLNLIENDENLSIVMAIGGNFAVDGKYQMLVRTNSTTTAGIVYATQPISRQTSGNTYLQALSTGKIILFPYGSGVSRTFLSGTYDLYFMW